MATATNLGSFMATITHPTGNGYCRDRILRDRPDYRHNLKTKVYLKILANLNPRECGSRYTEAFSFD